MANQTSDNNKRIVKNTLLLYVWMLFTMAVSLFTSRVILNTLGVEDYGIYNVVGRLVSMFSHWAFLWWARQWGGNGSDENRKGYVWYNNE